MISYGELLKKSDNCLRFLKSISLDGKALRGRFGEYKKLTKTIWDDIQNGNTGGVLNLVNKKGTRNGDVAMFALKEFLEMVQIIEQVEKLYKFTTEPQKKIIVQKINAILGSVAYTKDENNSNNQARNYQFELLIASKLYISGITDITFEEHPDIMVKVGTLKYAIECKRIFGDFEAKVIRRAEEALKQISLIKNDIFCGAIAVDLSTKYEQGKNLVTGNSRESIENFAQNCLEQDLYFIYRKSPKIIKAGKKKFLIGIFGNISSIYALKDKSEMGHLNQIAVLALNKENPIKAINFLKDFDNLKTINTLRKQ